MVQRGANKAVRNLKRDMAVEVEADHIHSNDVGTRWTRTIKIIAPKSTKNTGVKNTTGPATRTKQTTTRRKNRDMRNLNDND